MSERKRRMYNMNKGSVGVHRAKNWQIIGFSLNNFATNMYMFMMNFIAYYLTGFVGVAVVLASSLISMMRIWDGITDPFIGAFIDRTKTRFGKFRPYMVIGNAILAVTSFIMFFFIDKVPQGGRFIFFVLVYLVYIVGYTFQCAPTRAAQVCITNDPSQRPMFAVYNGILTALLFAIAPVIYTGYLVPANGGFTIGFFHDAWKLTASVGAICTVIAVISIAAKDRPEYFGLVEEGQKIGLKDYWDVLKNNRALQMLMLSEGTDKLATTCQSNAIVGVIIYAIVCSDYSLNGAVSAYTTIPSLLFLLFGAGYIARKMGQKKAMVFGSVGGLITCILSMILFYVCDPSTMSFPGLEGFSGWNFFSLAFLVLWICMKGFTNISTQISQTMVADCTDYEVYRSGRFVPGMVGTLYTFVDKLISSLSATVIGLCCAAIGFKDTLPTIDTPYSPALKFIGVFCLFGLVAIGLVVNLIAMKYYPLTKEKMAEIQDEINAIKHKA